MSARRPSRSFAFLQNRSLYSFGLLGVLSLALASSPAMLRAQDAEPRTEVENSKFQFEGVINANAVFVHSGASDNDYPTMKLDHGATVTVVGVRFDWLKVIPPEGSFCYVAKAYVEKRGDGTVGRTTNTVYVRVGSQLNELKIKAAMKLDAGNDVAILGEEQDYFKIKPPEGVYLYINKQYVDPVKPVAVAPQAPSGGATAPPAQDQAGGSSLPAPGDAAASPSKAGGHDASAPPGVSGSALADAPTTQPDAVASAQADFDKLEANFATESAKPLEEQDPATLAVSYDKLVKGASLPDSLRRIAEYKAAALRVRTDDREQYLVVKKQQDDMKARLASLKAEHEELETRVKQSEIKSYAAVGTLRASSLQQGAETLYRLTDPTSGRTVIYLRTNDTKLGTMMNQFIGVKGDVTTDSQLNLKLIEPTSFDAVDPAKLYTNVMAQIVPPSLLAAGQAATGN